ncbi:MAG: acylphosphatase [Bacteroidota bacterium]
MIHVNITVTGKVQRIGFRFSSMQEAIKIGVYGFVMNVDHDKVYLEAEGEEEKVNKFVEWCKSGPSWARVSDISVETGEIKNFTSFEIVPK